MSSLDKMYLQTEMLTPFSPQILLQGKNPGVVWEYTLPRTERKPDYSWGVVRSDCSAPCAGGESAFEWAKYMFVCVCVFVW